MRIFHGVAIAALGMVLSNPASALTSKECLTKYQAAKQAGTLNGQKWNDFRSAECGAEAKPTAATTTVPNPVSPTPSKAAAPAPAPSAPPAKSATAPSPSSAAAPSATPAGTPVFPKAIDPKYSDRSAGKARMQTCLDQYNTNKAAGSVDKNGGLKWIEKGGGYYSVCNKGLKG